MSSVRFFETSAQADDSSKACTTWVTDEKFETVLPNAPKIPTETYTMSRRTASSGVSAPRLRREGPHCGPSLWSRTLPTRRWRWAALCSRRGPRCADQAYLGDGASLKPSRVHHEAAGRTRAISDQRRSRLFKRDDGDDRSFANLADDEHLQARHAVGEPADDVFLESSLWAYSQDGGARQIARSYDDVFLHVGPRSPRSVLWCARTSAPRLSPAGGSRAGLEPGTARLRVGAGPFTRVRVSPSTVASAVSASAFGVTFVGSGVTEPPVHGWW